MTIEGFENENIEVSEFGEWVGSNYIDYKADYKEHQKIIKELFKEKQELIDYLKEQIKLCKEAQQLALNNKMIEQIGNFNLRIATYNEILSKIEKE